MKHILAIILLFACFCSVNAQSDFQNKKLLELEKINSVKEADRLLKTDKTVRGWVGDLNILYDTGRFERDLFNIPLGQTQLYGDPAADTLLAVKMLEEKSGKAYRVNAIYFNGGELSVSEINNKRKHIRERLARGEQFEALAKEYSMDNARHTGGDYGWFDEGRMVEEFESAVKKHKQGEIYDVDIPSRGWYYLVKNTHAPTKSIRKQLLYLFIRK